MPSDLRALTTLPVHLALTAIVVVAGTFGILVGWHEPSRAHDAIAITTGVVGVALILWVRYGLRVPWASATLLYLALLWLFHFGLTFTTALVPSSMKTLSDEDFEWLFSLTTRKSMLLALAGAGAYAAAAGAFAAATNPSRAIPEVEHDDVLYWTGSLIMAVGLAGVIFILATSGGPALLSMSYLDFRATVLGPTRLTTALDLSQLGCLLAICGGGGTAWRKPLAVWLLVIPVPFMLLGMRSTVMIPMLAYIVAISLRGVRVRTDVLGASALAASILMPAVYAVRNVGYAQRDDISWTQFTPLDAMMEFGGSLRATQAYVDWIDSGDHYLLGSSYWAPFDRQILAHVLPGHRVPETRDDPRIPLRQMDERQGAVGGSAAGEAYYNFGMLGPLLYFGAVGALFGWLEWRVRRTPYTIASFAVVMLGLCFNIRSDWLAVPASIGEGLALVAACRVLAYLFRPAHKRRAAACAA
jgi:hypothetical protein